jgi:ribosome-associated protein
MASTVFIQNNDTALIEEALWSLLSEAKYSSGTAKKVTVARIGHGQRGWCVLVADAPFDFSRAMKNSAPYLAGLSRRLNCSAFQLDVTRHAVGLLEAGPTGQYLISGELARWDDGHEPDLNETGNQTWAQSSEGITGPLRAQLREFPSEHDEHLREVLALTRTLVGPDFHPFEPGAFEFQRERDLVYRVKSAAPLSSAPKPAGITPAQAARALSLSDEALLLECDEKFFIASGPGGQHRNKTETGVRLTHRPTALTVTATERRSQLQNRGAALERLRETFQKLSYVAPKRFATKPSRASKQRRIAAKKHTSEKKQNRRVDS